MSRAIGRRMIEASIGIAVFAALSGAFFLVLRLQHLLPVEHLSDETTAVVRLGAGVIATLSALVLSLVISTVETSFDGAARDVRSFSGAVVRLDADLRAFGPEAASARAAERDYALDALRRTWSVDGAGPLPTADGPGGTGTVLGRAVFALPAATRRQSFYGEASEQALAALVAGRQKLITDDAPSLPPLFLGLVVFWLTILFGSFGYRAPVNGLVVATVLFVAAAVASALYLLVEMDGSFQGLIVVSAEPLRSAIAIIASP